MKYYYCLHNCIINGIECIEGVCLTKDEWDLVLEQPKYDITFNKFYFAEVPTKDSLPNGRWGNGGKCNVNLQPEIKSDVVERFLSSLSMPYFDTVSKTIA